MRVLRIIATMNPKNGGPCQGIRNSIPALKNIGIENEVVCFDNPNEEFLESDKIMIYPIGASQGSWSYNSKFSDWLKENFVDFDVIIIHGLWLYHSFASNKTIQHIKKIKNISSPKIYVMPHGMLDPWFQKASGRRLKAIRNWFYWHLIEKNVINQADGILFTCEQEKILAKDTFSGYRPKAELNIGYGIKQPPALTDFMLVAFNKKYSINGNSYLLYLSRLHEKKGTDLLIKAYLALRAQGISLPKLVIAGPGIETDFGVKIQKMAAQDPDIVFPGMLTGDAKWGAIYGCEAFILPSHQENFGIAVAEALACGKPVLISDQVNIWKEINDVNGGLIEKDTFDGTKSLILKYVNLSIEQKNEMRNNATIAYKKYFTVEQAAIRMQEVLLSNLSLELTNNQDA